MEHSHRPGPSHQQNKARKARHDSKRSQKNKTSGRVDATGSSGHRLSAKAGSFDANLSKLQRKNAAKADKRAKRADMLQKRRAVQENTAPKVVGFIPLTDRSSLEAAAAVLVTDGSCKFTTDAMTAGAPFHITAGPGRPANLTLAFAPRETDAILDLCKVADIIVLIHVAGEDHDTLAEQILSSVRAQGAPTVVGLIQNVDALPQKMRHGVRKDFGKFVRQNFPSKDEPKSFDSSIEADRKNMVRHICGLRPRQVTWRCSTPNMLLDNLHYTEENCSLRVSGFVRGQALSPNQLVHIVGHGTYKLRQMEVFESPFESYGTGQDNGGLANPPKVSATDSSQVPALNMENEVDIMAGEQTWPTEDEMQAADEARRNGDVAIGSTQSIMHKRRVPTGTSEYQAAWYAGSDEDENLSEAGSDSVAENVFGEQQTEVESPGADDFDDMDEETERHDNMDDIEVERQRRREAAEDDEVFPDEVDTPMEGVARERFARYRGMKSFRSSPWDPKESLPQIYARIFEFSNFSLARKRVHEEHEVQAELAHPGEYVALVLEGVAPDVVASLQLRALGANGNCPAPIVLAGLLAHENQMTVMHMLVQRSMDYEDPIRSKDPMVVHVGFRRFSSRPIYSDHNTNCDKSKFQRYMTPGFVVATVFAPACWANNCPALLFTPAAGAVMPLLRTQSRTLAAAGSILSFDPNRVILKRTILTGFPYKIHKTRAVVRYMFFNAEDIHWFKPIELRTKMGRTGHILDSVGSHGYMKCQFDGQLRGNDSVCVHLYKRTFAPEWDLAWFG